MSVLLGVCRRLMAVSVRRVAARPGSIPTLRCGMGVGCAACGLESALWPPAGACRAGPVLLGG